jgi:hypothetical protein
VEITRNKQSEFDNALKKHFAFINPCNKTDKLGKITVFLKKAAEPSNSFI